MNSLVRKTLKVLYISLQTQDLVLSCLVYWRFGQKEGCVAYVDWLFQLTTVQSNSNPHYLLSFTWATNLLVFPWEKKSFTELRSSKILECVRELSWKVHDWQWLLGLTVMCKGGLNISGFSFCTYLSKCPWNYGYN